MTLGLFTPTAKDLKASKLAQVLEKTYASIQRSIRFAETAMVNLRACEIRADVFARVSRNEALARRLQAHWTSNPLARIFPVLYGNISDPNEALSKRIEERAEVLVGEVIATAEDAIASLDDIIFVLHGFLPHFVGVCSHRHSYL